MTSLTGILPMAARAQSGAELFQATCNACHTIGGGRRVGPDLQGVTERRSEEWLLAFIRSSQAVIRGGDADATALFQEYGQMVMPDYAGSEADIRAIIAYIAGGGDGGGGGGGGFEGRVYGEQDVERGRQLFQGTTRLANGGAACNSCHHVQNDAVIGGGVLAKDLTQVFSRAGGGGVGAILGSAPFPVMERAYKDDPLTEEEIHALIAFLQHADREHAFQTPKDYGVLLVAYGAGGFAVLMILYGFLWRRRKQRSVNQAIYDRQVRSS